MILQERESVYSGLVLFDTKWMLQKGHYREFQVPIFCFILMICPWYLLNMFLFITWKCDDKFLVLLGKLSENLF